MQYDPRESLALERFPLAGQKISIEPQETFASPSFRTRYPPVRNLELVPDGVRLAMEESWARGQFEERTIEIFLIHGAYVIGECLILDNDLRVTPPLSMEPEKKEYPLPNRAWQKAWLRWKRSGSSLNGDPGPREAILRVPVACLFPDQPHSRDFG